jgi:hypothetical protein
MMSLNRRKMITGAGASALVLMAGAGTWRVMRRPRTALLPWSLETSPPADIRLDAFRHAILAPNPHNRQPWLIRLEGDDGATISCDLDRRLPETDPFDRQITIGFGTFLELARMAAAERGVRLDIEPFPEGEPAPRLDARPVAKLRFVADETIAPDPLFAFILKRHTNRLMYESGQLIADSLLRQIADGTSTTDENLIAQVRQITVAATTIEHDTPRTFGESVNLMRIGAEEIDANPDGITLAGPKMEALKLLGMLDKSALADPASSAFKTGLKIQQDISGSIPALLWIITPGNSRLHQLEAGRRYVRANLRAAARGVAMHPLSQGLQEYSEMADRFEQIHKLLGVKPGERIQMLARVGYAALVGPSARWPLETHLRA